MPEGFDIEDKSTLLTDEEVSKIGPSRKSPRPQYFNSSFKSYVTISQDFESFLVLADAGAKAAALSWIQTLVEFSPNVTQSDDLLKEWVETEEGSVEEVDGELTSLLEEFDKFRSAFKAGKFSSVTEVQRFLAATQAKLYLLTDMRDALDYRKRIRTKTSADLTNKGNPSDIDEELLSFMIPISSY